MTAVERARRPGDAAGEVEVEEEVLPQRLLGGEAVPRDHLAQRRQQVLAHAAAFAMRAASRMAAMRLFGIGDALAGDAKRRAVVGRGADEGQAQADIDAAVEVQRLHRDQRLVVIHAEDRVIGGARLGMEGRIGGERAQHAEALLLQGCECRADDVDFLAAHGAVLARMGIEAGEGEARLGNAEDSAAGPAR